jgi:ATP-dependent helicase/nuclease subunit A
MNSIEKIKEKKLDQDQIAVRDADSNVVVTAGAGSGKTTVLAERYVRLVCERNISVNEILTLTFTRKAASEMYSRIYQRLLETNHPNAVAQLKRFDQARISTLDSFCALICRGASYRYGISDNFRMDEMELAKIAEDTAVDVIMMYRDEKVIHNLVSSRTFDDTVKNIFADMGMRHVSIIDNYEFEKLAEKQICFLESEINNLWKRVEEICNEILSIDDQTNNNTIVKAKNAIKNFPSFQKINDEIIKQLNVAAAFLKSGNSFRTPASNVTNAALVELRDSAILLKESAGKLEKVLDTYFFKDDIIQLGKICNEYAKRFNDKKRRKGILSFKDVSELAVTILKDDSDLRNYYKKQFKAIMIDEFQDNNNLQKELLYLLAEREDVFTNGIPSEKNLMTDKLFFVGDEKQSIYRFRDADVSVFRGLSIELTKSVNAKNNNPVSMALQTNYRSHPELVIFFNQFFAEVFGEPEHLFEAEYHPMLSGKTETDETLIDDKRIEIYLQEIFPFRKSEKNADDDLIDESIDAASSEAVYAAERIISGVKSGEFLFRDVAILFRSTTHQNSYERCFRNIGIPFSAADPRGIFAEAVMNDFYAILRLVLFPQDTNAYATVLRSPFVKIGDGTFVHIMSELQENPFAENPPEHWFQNEYDKDRYDQGKLLFHQLEEKIDVEEISEVVSFLWYETSYRAELMNNPETFPLLEHFNYLYNLTLDAGGRKLNMSSFLDELAPLVGTYSKADGGDPELENDAVTMMTVHKSKGLEFKILIIADAGSAGHQQSGAYFISDDFGPVVNMKSIYSSRNDSSLNYIYEISKAENQMKSEAELKRLFYVAATRAEERLVIFGSRKINKDIAEQLGELKDEERLNTLLCIPRYSSSRKTECKDSFLDLLYLAVNKMNQKNIHPNWQTKNISLLSLNDEKQKSSELRFLMKTLQSHNQSSQNMMMEKNYQPTKKYFIPMKRIIHPSALENIALAGLEKNNFGKILSSFSCDHYLINDDLKKAFGTLCHFIIEKLFDDESFEKIPHGVIEIFRKENLKLHEIKKILDAAIIIGQTFYHSDLGKQIVSAHCSETEYPFYLPFNKEQHCESIMVRGIIDLLFETDNECIVIDFKTDQYMNPEIHQIQMDTYRLAAKAFSDLPVKIMIVYLRSMEAVIVNPVLSEENLFSVMDEMLKMRETESR